MNCPNCKNQIPEDSLFCPFCGNKVIKTDIGNDEVAEEKTTIQEYYFDDDYGYTCENPIVVSSVEEEGYYLNALRNKEGAFFSWKREKIDEKIDKYDLLINGEVYKTIFFNPHGVSKTELHVPKNLVLDKDGFEAAKRGIDASEYEEKKKEQLEKEKVQKQEKDRKRKSNKKKIIIIIIILVLIALSIGAYYGGRAIYYEIAFDNYFNSNYDVARTMFHNLGDYEDSREYYVRCSVRSARNYLDKGDYETAESLVRYIGTQYEKNEINTILEKCAYLEGVSKYKAGETKNAYDLFYKSQDELNYDKKADKDMMYNYAVDVLTNGLSITAMFYKDTKMDYSQIVDLLDEMLDYKEADFYKTLAMYKYVSSKKMYFYMDGNKFVRGGERRKQTRLF